MKPKNLIISRSGEKSLHQNWLKGAEPNFDLEVTFYGSEIPDDWTATNSYSILPIKGSKWKGLYKYLTLNDTWRNYEKILLPDDDLLCNAHDINQIFNLANELNADLCQPSLDRNSYFTHPITLNHHSFNYRHTNFVELMIPCFSRRMLESTLELFNLTESGWGMDNYWWKIIQENNFSLPVILDDVSVTHTRPVGSANNGTSGTGMSPFNEMKFFNQQLLYTPPPIINLSGKIRKFNTPLSISGANKFIFHSTLINDIISMSGQAIPKQQVDYIIRQQSLLYKYL